jgi:hypothetical protein
MKLEKGAAFNVLEQEQSFPSSSLDFFWFLFISGDLPPTSLS